MYCNVLVTKPFDKTFTYKIESKQKVRIGSIVGVSFGKGETMGIVYNLFNKIPSDNSFYKIKKIEKVYNNLTLNNNIIKLIEWVADYTLAPKGLVLKLFLVNKNIINHKIINKEKIECNPKTIQLNIEQKKAFNTINKFIINKSSTIVLEGVTGSGKTEVYFQVIEKILYKKKQALIMLPEISLTPQLQQRFKERFGFYPLIWHSKISEKNRKNIWHQCYFGNSLIVIGARSSLFLPFKNLGVIIVDEEHDLSFKQEDNIRYQGRDLAIVRSKIEKFPIILSTATPSLETQNNIFKKKFIHVNLPSQFSGLQLPKINLINLKEEKLKKNKWISTIIFEQIKNCVEKGEQVLLFLNRRGYSPLSLCLECGYRYQCDFCSTWLVMHKNKNRLLCHHCGKIYTIKSICPRCSKKDTIKLVGPGIERLEEEVKDFFPNYKVGLMSSDNANTPKKIKNIIEKFDTRKIDILIATQIMAKGYHFSNLSLVGVIDADAGLIGGDIRAIERTYNLLQQVSGRAGRSRKLGQVFIQTYFPNLPLIQTLISRDRKKFVKLTLSERKEFDMPPFSYLTSIIISGAEQSKTALYSNNLVKNMDLENEISVLGPVKAPLFLLRGQYRYRLLLKGKNRKFLNIFTRNLIKKCPPPSNLRLVVDVDPYTFF